MSCCGRSSHSSGSRQTAVTEGPPPIDPTRALFAAATPAYVVVRNAGETSDRGKRFSTQLAAEDYARRIGGIIRQL